MGSHSSSGQSGGNLESAERVEAERVARVVLGSFSHPKTPPDEMDRGPVASVM